MEIEEVKKLIGSASKMPTLEKKAFGKSEIWKKVVEFLDKAKVSAQGTYGSLKSKYTNLTPAEKTLVNAAGGSLVGGAAGGLIGGKKGLLVGSALGGTAGAASGVDWKAVAEALKSYKKTPVKSESATVGVK